MPSSFNQPSLADYSEIFRRRLKTSATVLCLILGVSVFAAIVLPDVYRSGSEMRIELKGPNVDVLEPLALTTYADQYVKSLEKRVTTYDEIWKWIQETNVYSEERDRRSLSDLAVRIKDHIRIRMVTTTIKDPHSGKPVDLITGFIASFDAHKPQDSLVIAERLAAAFLEEDREIRTGRAAVAASFIQEEIDAKQQEITRLEAKIAVFKETNAGSLPELMGLNMTILERTERDLQAIDTDVRSLQQDKIFRESQLEEIRQGSTSADRLQQLEAEYLRVISIYGANHPDVIRIKRQVTALTDGAVDSGKGDEVLRLEAELAEARQRYSDLHPDVMSLKRQLEILRSRNSAGSNERNIDPQYLRLRAEVNAIDTRLSGLRDRARTLQAKHDEIEDRIAQMPQVELKYLALSRDLQTEQLAFNELRTKMARAQRTESFESGEGGARLVKIRSAFLPSKPVAPPRIAIVVLGGILAVALALGAIIMVESLDGSVRGRRDIERLVNTPPIAEIPVIRGSASAVPMSRQIVIIGTAVIVIGAAIFVIWSNT